MSAVAEETLGVGARFACAIIRLAGIVVFAFPVVLLAFAVPSALTPQLTFRGTYGPYFDTAAACIVGVVCFYRLWRSRSLAMGLAWLIGGGLVTWATLLAPTVLHPPTP